MSTIKSSAENLTLNADGANNDVIIQSNGSTKVTVDGQNSRVGIGTASPILPLSIKASQEQLTISEGDARGSTFDYRSSTGNLQIATNGANARSAPQLTLNLNGDITANTGNLVIGTSGKGIDFSANSHASGMTSELLDSYEEGAWSPTITGDSGSYVLDGGANSAVYTKIGRLVTCQGHLSVSSDNSASGSLKMSLPFTPSSMGDDQEYVFAHLHLGNTGTTTAGTKQLFILAGGAYLSNVTDGGVVSYLTHTAVDANWQMGFSFTYIVQ